jgi:hypothetical protein
MVVSLLAALIAAIKPVVSPAATLIVASRRRDSSISATIVVRRSRSRRCWRFRLDELKQNPTPQNGKPDAFSSPK